MVVRKTKRVTEMTAGPVGRGAQRRSAGGGAFGRGWCGVAGAVLGALATIASVGPAAGQGGQSTSVAYKVPSVDYRPLALAYLAARYVGDFKGRASDFRSAPISPGTSIHARFLKAQTEYPWEGIPFGLFLRETRLTVGEGTVSLGVGKPLNMALYAFLEDMKVLYSVRVRTFDSDAWRKQPDGYSVLSDTTFFLQTDVPPPFAFVTGAYIACVNERSGSAGNPSNPACKESEGGQVIEDPMSETGEPALLMVGRSGLPEWLTEVPTDVCAAEADPGKLPRIAVPTGHGRHQEIELAEKFGDRWCIRVANLNYVAVRADGMRIGDTLKKRLDSRHSKGGRAWTMLAAAPSPDGAQRIVLYPPASSGPVVSVLKPVPPVEATAPATLEITLTKDTPQDIIRIARLWYGPWQAGDGDLGKCEALKKRTIYSTDRLSVRPKGEHRTLTVTLQERTQYNLKQKHALVAQIADGRIYCGIATAAASGGLAVALRPEESSTSAGAKVSTAPAPKVPTPGKAVPIAVTFDSDDKNALKQLVHAGGAKGRRGVFPKVDPQRLSFSLKRGSGVVFGGCSVTDEPGLRCSVSDDRQHIDIAHTGGEVPETIRVSLAFTLPTRQIALTFLLEGPARLSIQQVSQDKQQASKEKLTDLNGPRDTGSVLARIVQWSPNDKLRVTPVDPEFQEVSEISVDGTKVWPLQHGKRTAQDDKGIEIPLKPDAKAPGIVIKTADRLFSVPMTVVTSPKTAIDIKLETRLKQEKVTTLSIDTQPGQVPLAEVKPDHILTIELKNKERLEVEKMLLRGGKAPRAIIGPVLKFQRDDFLGAKLALNLDIAVREAAFSLPEKFRLQPVVQIGKRELLLRSCKVELEDFLEGSKFTSKGGYTEVTLAQDKRAPKTRTYDVKVHRDAKVCSELEVGRPIKAAQLKELRLDATLPVLLRRPTSRAFVGVVSLPKDIRSKEHNWRAALEALRDVFDAGAREGKYLWGAIYGPQGQLLVTSGDTADYAPFDLDEVASGSKMDSLTGGAGLPFGSLVSRVAGLKDIADFEGNVDTLVVADEPFRKCGWSDPPFAQGSRAAFVRLTSSVSGGREIVSGVRVCESDGKGDKKSSDRSRVVAEIEVVPKEWSRGAENDVQLRRAIAEAAKGFAKTQSSQSPHSSP